MKARLVSDWKQITYYDYTRFLTITLLAVMLPHDVATYPTLSLPRSPWVDPSSSLSVIG